MTSAIAYSIALSGEELKDNIRLLGVLRAHLKTDIESVVVPGQKVPYCDSDLEQFEIDQQNLQKADELLKTMSNVLRAGVA